MAYGRVYFAEYLLPSGNTMKLCKDCKHVKYIMVFTKCSYNSDYAISPIDGKVQSNLLKSADMERTMSGRCKPKGINFEPITLKGKVKRYFDKYKSIIILMSVLYVSIFILSIYIKNLLNSPIIQEILYCSK